MDLNLRKVLDFTSGQVNSFSNQFRLTIGIFSIVLFLFFIAPEDGSDSFPILHGSRFLWTPLIPVLSSICIGTWAFLSLNNRLSRKEAILSSTGVPFLIFLSLQFATSSPVGVDGWFFLSSAQYYSQFGQSGAANYMSHPLVMMPVDMWIRTFGGSGRTFSALFGFIMSLSWIIIIVGALTKSPNFNRYGVLILSGLSLFFLASGWYPLRYSAHLLGLFGGDAL